jgi:hypothetical protein
MLGTKPESTEFAERLMYLSGGLAVAAGLFAWLTTRATVYWLAVELALGMLWLGATRAIQAGRPLARIAATVLCVISIPVTGIMLILLSLFAGNWPGVIVMFCDVIRLPLPLVIIVLLWRPGPGGTSGTCARGDRSSLGRDGRWDECLMGLRFLVPRGR